MKCVAEEFGFTKFSPQLLWPKPVPPTVWSLASSWLFDFPDRMQKP